MSTDGKEDDSWNKTARQRLRRNRKRLVVKKHDKDKGRRITNTNRNEEESRKHHSKETPRKKH